MTPRERNGDAVFPINTFGSLEASTGSDFIGFAPSVIFHVESISAKRKGEFGMKNKTHHNLSANKSLYLSCFSDASQPKSHERRHPKVRVTKKKSCVFGRRHRWTLRCFALSEA